MHRVVDRIPVVVQDGLLALVVIAVSLTELATSDDTMTPGEQSMATALLVAEGAVLVGRHVHPVLVWLAAGCLVSAYGLGPYPDPALHFGALIAVYSVAAHTSRRTAAVAGVITLAAVVTVLLVDGDADLADWAVNVLTLASAWLLGDLMRTQRAYAAEVASRAALRELQQDEEARRAVLEERARISPRAARRDRAPRERHGHPGRGRPGPPAGGARRGRPGLRADRRHGQAGPG